MARDLQEQLELDFCSPTTVLGEPKKPASVPVLTTANDVQVGGKHYKELNPQPWDVITAWGMGFLEGNVVKYVARWREKDGLKDLHKARHYLDKLIEKVESEL